MVLDINELLANTYEPLRSYRWIIGINGIDAFTAKTFSRPKRSFEEIQIDYINTKRWLAGKHTWNDVTLALYDPIAPSAAAKVMEWVRFNFDEQTGRAGYAKVYKETINLKMLDPLGNIAQEWELRGAWARDVDFGDLDYNSSDAVPISLTIRYDSAPLISVLAAEAV